MCVGVAVTERTAGFAAGALLTTVKKKIKYHSVISTSIGRPNFGAAWAFILSDAFPGGALPR